MNGHGHGTGMARARNEGMLQRREQLEALKASLSDHEARVQPQGSDAHSRGGRIRPPVAPVVELQYRWLR
jgi:hypothetical protein